ncbi:hypothetical protein N8D56_19200 [Devosia sp. A8/3-2]|nr:hypothetical protein N8D56_19200 [Devosia sp. A8/3-2]
MSSIGTVDSGAFTAGSKGFGLAVLRAKTGRLLDIPVGFWVFTGALVFIEPSPYELSFVAVLPVAISAGMGLYRSTFGLFAIMIGFIPFCADRGLSGPGYPASMMH